MLLLPATVTADEARDTLDMLAQALKREPDAGVVVDASNLQQFDSSALAVLLECQRLAAAWGKGFAVKHAPAKLASLARLYGVDELVGMVPPDVIPAKAEIHA
jgi:phospholipid transport system transporter-binding protein